MLETRANRSTEPTCPCFGNFALPVMVEQLIVMEEYAVALFTEKIASKFSPTGRAPIYGLIHYPKAFCLSSIFGLTWQSVAWVPP
jgi:hypothetical protein